MSNTVSLLEILAPFELWTIQFTRQGLSRTVYSASTERLGLESSVSTPLKPALSLLSLTKSMAKLCTWSSTAVFADEQLLPIFNRRVSLKWPFTLFAILKRVSAWLLHVEISRQLWKAPFPWSSSKVLTARLVMSGV